MSAAVLLLSAILSSTSAGEAHELELGLLPAINFDSDLGFGFGLLGAGARYHPESVPWKWRLEGLVFLTVKKKPDGGFELPFTDNYLLVDLPGLLGGTLRLGLRGSFQRHRSRGYFGIGNGAREQKDQLASTPRFHQYDRIAPSTEIAARIDPGGGFQLLIAARWTQSWINIYAGSQVDLERTTLIGTNSHGEVGGIVGIIFDSRDRETSPSAGHFHEVSVRGGAGVGEAFGYSGVNLTLRSYFSLLDRAIVLAARLLADVLSGDVPLYELARHGGFFPQDTTGGASSIRGIAAQRFHGKVKVLSNVELRVEAPPFSLFEQSIYVGGIGLVDLGRVWSSFAAPEELDGRGLGIHAGVGAGLRVRWGETFVIRADFAYSPTDGTTGIYIDLNHVF